MEGGTVEYGATVNAPIPPRKAQETKLAFHIASCQRDLVFVEDPYWYTQLARGDLLKRVEFSPIYFAKKKS